MPAQTSDIEETSRIVDGLVTALADVCACKSLQLLPSQVCRAATVAGTRLSVLQHMQKTYKLHKHCWSSKLDRDFLEKVLFESWIQIHTQK